MNTTTNNQSSVVLKAIKQVEYDRVVFLTYTNSVLSGLNFHQGIENLDYDFANPNEALTNIYDRLGKPSDAFEMSRVNKAINLYCEAFIFQNDEPYTLDKSQRDLIKKALDYYVATSERFNQHPTQEEAYDIFDMKQLSPMMNYQIQVVISEQEKNNFSKHGIDFPMQ
tara:strand:- start:6897 stop:7400 length:504 start_codon:yes stop_codon:yes gene_type:complete